VPDHAPAAEHEDAFAELHVSVETPPLATDVGFAVRDTDADTDAAAGDSSPAPPQAASTSATTRSRPLNSKLVRPVRDNGRGFIYMNGVSLTFFLRPSSRAWVLIVFNICVHR